MKIKLLLPACMLLIVSCEEDQASKRERDDQYIASNISIVYLKDGTKCAVYGSIGGLSCDWTHASQQREVGHE